MLFVTDHGDFKVDGKMESEEHVRISLEIGFAGGIESSLREMSMELLHWGQGSMVIAGSLVSNCNLVNLSLKNTWSWCSKVSVLKSTLIVTYVSV